MSKDTTLHVKVSAFLADGLRHIAAHRHQSISELVRIAINAYFQIEVLNLKNNERQALEAYVAGYISIGKLAQEMGYPVAKMGQWLNERGFKQNVSFLESDVENA